MIILAVVILGAMGVSGYFYNQYQKTQKELQAIKTDPTMLGKAAGEEVKRLVAEVGKLIDLPEKETPTVATVTDIEKLKSQAFFAKAKNGDKVLIYTNAKKAILYDPAAKKIIDVAPINIGSSSAAQSNQSKIALRNGTKTVGLTGKAEIEIKKAFPEVNIVSKENAAGNDFEKSVVVVLTDSAKDFASNLATFLKINIGQLPKGESKPQDADILIILGKDKSG